MRAVALPVAVACVVAPILHGSSSDSAEIQVQLADQLFAEARYIEALDAYERAVRQGAAPTVERARRGIVHSALRVAEFSRARTEAEALAAARPADADDLALYGDALWASGLFLEAEDVVRRALGLDPLHARARHGLARTLAARSRLDDALAEARAALELAPKDAELHHTLGSIYERMHRYEEAGPAFSGYVGLLPNRDRSLKAAWARAEIKFLQSFAGRQPFDMPEASREMLHTVAFRLVKDKVVIRARVNDGRDLDFVVDTGSEQTVIAQKTAERLGVKPIVNTLSAGVGEVGLRGLQLGRLESLAMGTLRITNVPCLIKNPPLEDLPIREGESFSPLALGMSMTIDYGRRVLILGRKIPDEPADFELPLRLHRLAMVRGTVEGDPVNFVVDTGGEVISISTDTASTLSREPATRRIPLKVFGSSGWDRDAFLMPGIDLAFDRIEFSNFPIVVLNLRAPSVLLGFQVGGIVGHRFLSKYRVSMDLDRSVLRLHRLDAPRPADSRPAGGSPSL